MYTRIDEKGILRRIKMIQKNLGVGQVEFGKLIRPNAPITQTTISHWWKNQKPPKDLETLASIANLGGRSLDWLILGERAGRMIPVEWIRERETNRDIDKICGALMLDDSINWNE